ncbi:VPS10 domain-containing protein [Fontibacter flavus]|uniref:Glycosyl hydrolase n=1 Tax=Fontibacter flavus TaxID=654838 RepID=A0ABV6FYY3_9BACT
MKKIYQILSLLLVFSISTFAQQQVNGSYFNQLDFRFIGPDGNRTIAVRGEPGNNMVMYVGMASGGLFKTEDGGGTWNSIFDDQDISSVSALALAPSDPNQVWVGTGETFLIRPAHAMGNGIYKSTDAGKTFQNMGLKETARIGQIEVDPRNPDVVYVAGLGHTYGKQKDRGVYKTIDGGKTWENVLFVDEGTGAVDLAMNPKNPDIVFAAFWSIDIKTWGLNSGGPGGGIYRTKDGGKTWESMKNNGLPGGDKNPVGKSSVAISYSNPNVVYALFEMDSPQLWKSTDGGDSWELTMINHTINERAPYYTRLRVSTDDPDEIYFASVRFSTSKDGGKTLAQAGYRAGGDNHDIWVDPLNANRILVAHDGGMGMTWNKQQTYKQFVFPNAQMYHVWTDNQVPYNVYGNRQDGYSYRGPSNSRQGSIPLGLWHAVGGCESGWAIPDPVDNNIVWSGCYDGGLQVYDLRTGHARDVRVWPEAGYGWAPADLKYRWHWSFPIFISPHFHKRVYVGSQFVHMTEDYGQSWKIISPDLTRNDKSHQQSSGGIATDNLMTFDASVLFAIAESHLEDGLIWVGSNDGLMHITRDGGKNWENITANIPGKPELGTISSIEPSRHRAGTAYVTVDAHQLGDFDPYVYKTSDYGKTWVKISDGIEKSESSFVHVTREDPKVPGLLYTGTDKGLYISKDDGKTWFRLRNNLPPVPIYWLTIQEEFNDMVIGTYGRGFYILDDITPIRELSAEILSKDMHLFSQRPAYRFQEVQGIKTEGRSMTTGSNPPYGMDINYYLKSPAKEVKIEILKKDGTLIRTISGKKEAGVNRVWWDLRHEPTLQPKLLVAPPDKPWVKLEGREFRPLVTWDLDLYRGQFGPRVVPGDYVVRVTVDGKTELQNVTVLKDPNTAGTLDDIEKQVSFSLNLNAAMNEVVTTINEIEEIRKELEELVVSKDDRELQNKIKELEAKILKVEGELFDINLTGAREDAFRAPMKLYGRISALASDAGGFGADFKPTNQQVEVYNVFRKQLDDIQVQYKKLINEEIPLFNQYLISKDLELRLKK